MFISALTGFAKSYTHRRMSDHITGDPCERLDYTECRLTVILWKTFAPIFLIVGLCGNILSIVVLSRKRMRVFTTSVYLRFLAIVDSSVLLIAVLRDLIYYYTAIDVGELSDLTCKIYFWLNYNVTGLSCWLLCAITLDRLIAVRYPLWAKSHCTKHTAVIVAIILTTIVSLLDSHFLLFMHKDEVYVSSNVSNTSTILEVKCSPSNHHYIVFNTQVWPILTFILYSFSPIVCLISCNVMLYRQLSRQDVKQQMGRQVSDAGKKRDRRDMKSLTKMLIVVCVIFVTISVPTCIYLIAAPYLFARTSPHDVAKRRFAWAIVAFFLYCNNTFNFIVYCVSGSLFRQELRGLFLQVKVFMLKCFSRRIFPVLTTEETRAGPSMVDNYYPLTSAKVQSTAATMLP